MIANFSSSFRRRQAGLSLIELMIALLIGSILLIGLVQVFGASRTAYQLSEGMSRTQENARFALLDSIDSMDRAAVISWADLHYKQKIPGNMSVGKARDIAKGFINQYGMPA